MTDPIAARAVLASRLAHHAGQTALGYFRNRASLEVETKNGTLDLVSVADRAVEEMIRAEIARAFPDDGVLGEEGGAEAGTSGLTWVIDSIDGTVPFLMGLPHWCVVIAITEGEETLVGVTDVPVTGEHYAARKGHGAALDRAPLHLGADRRIDQGLVAVGASERCDARRVLECHPAVAGSRQHVPSKRLWSQHAGLRRRRPHWLLRRAGHEPTGQPGGPPHDPRRGGRRHPFPADQRLGLAMGAAPGVWEDLHRIAAEELGGLT